MGQSDQDSEPKAPGEGGLSFDPSTWAKSGAEPKPGPVEPRADADAEGPPAEPAAPSASFDPSTWAARPSAPGSEPAAPPAAAKPGLDRRLLLGGVGVGGLALIGGAFLAFGHKAKAPEAQGSAPPQASTPEASAARASGPAAGGGAEHQALVLADLDGLQGALVSYGLAPDVSAKIAAAARAAMPKGSADTLRLELVLDRSGPKPSLASLTVSRPDGSGARVTPGPNGFVGAPMAASTHQEVKVARGQVAAESFYNSAISAGLSDALVPDFFQAFVYDFDFQREIEPGAEFEAVISGDANDQGAAIGRRKLLYASMKTKAKLIALYRFDAPGAKPDDAPWYDGSGRSIKRGLMRTPVEGARISSSFGYRVHPILGFEKLHKGTDFAAPVGTPIYAAGDGTVEWAAMKGPNGNLTILKHDNGWETYYLHQNAFAPGVTAGARVNQAQTIGWVGTTGRSTGPHLHYELHINGEAVDAMAQPLDAGQSLSGDALKAFLKQRDQIDKLRATSL